MSDGTLFIVATPIGNRDDLSPRARDTLQAVDIVASEDTRRTGRLLSHFGISVPQLSLHEHNEDAAAARVISALREGQSVALVSDAGTPLVSDPGYRLLRMAHEHGIRVSPVPGASALIAALSVAGIATDRFCFEGFLPARQSARRTALGALAAETRTLVFYESVHRIREMLADAGDLLGASRQAFVGRELTKLHEQCVQATLGELATMVDEQRIARKGEFVVVVAGAADVVAAPGIDADVLLEKLAGVLPGKQAVDIVASISGGRRNDLYRRMLELTGKSD